MKISRQKEIVVWTVVLVVAFVGVAADWFHAAMTFWIAPPFANPLDDLLFWLLILPLRLAMLAAITCWAVPMALRHLHRNPRRAAIAWFAFAAPILALTYGLNSLRPLFAKAFNNGVTRYYPTQLAAGETTVGWPGLDVFLKQWSSGTFQVNEFIFVAGICAIIVTAGYLLGKKPLAASLIAVPIVWIFTLAAGNMLYIAVNDYDMFYGSTVLGPATSDLYYVFFASDPASEFGMAIYLLVLVTACVLDAVFSRTSPAKM